jgi:enoyl-CoA hydratase/3-hydroxyacyl-CoA dehydrogenase
MVAEGAGMRVGVVGAGNMGAGIAQKFATEGASVLLLDLNDAGVAKGIASIHALLDEGLTRRVFRPQQVEAIKGRVQGTTQIEALETCDLIVEAVFEDLDVKRDVFRRLDKVCGPRTVLATNTSSFKVSQLQEGLAHPERLIGLHFFYHPAKNRLVEVIGGEHSDEDVLTWAWRSMEVLGKTPIASGDREGFVVNRFFVPWLNEAVRLLEQGVASTAAIDAAAAKAFGVGMGPFALMNATGVPIAMHAARTLEDAFGAFYRPADLLVDTVGQGENWSLQGDVDIPQETTDTIISRLAGAAWLAAGELVDEDVSNFEDVDLGARVGLRWQRGPFELANHLGLASAMTAFEGMKARWDVDVPRVFHEAMAKGDTGPSFQLSTVTTQIQGGVGHIVFNRPDQLNALSPSLLVDFETAWNQLESNPEVKAIILRGAGKAFMAGADLKFFADALRRQDMEALISFSGRAADLFARIDGSDKRVVALLDGLSLGGGTELLLCADVIISTDRGSLGFPETGIGIFPGLGGTQRSVRRVGRPVARYLVLTGKTVGAKEAHALGLVDILASRKEAVSVAHQVALADDLDTQLAPSASSVSKIQAIADQFLGDGAVEALVDGSQILTSDDAIIDLKKRLSSKAPLALRVSAKLIDLAEKGGDVSAGLAAEAEELGPVFSTRDALEGIQSVLERRKPSFEGR